MNKWLYCIIVLLAALLVGMGVELRKTDRKYETSMENIKAYALQNDSLRGKARGFEMTIDQLQQYGDSVQQEALRIAKEKKIKYKTIESIHYVKSTVTKTDTLVLNDTIFKEPDLKIDTVVGDKWYATKIGLEYPSKISVTPSFNSSQYIIVNSRKEIIGKPSKLFFVRWFQKKHTVLEVNVVEENPYVTIRDNKYVKILK